MGSSSSFDDDDDGLLPLDPLTGSDQDDDADAGRQFSEQTTTTDRDAEPDQPATVRAPHAELSEAGGPFVPVVNGLGWETVGDVPARAARLPLLREETIHAVRSGQVTTATAHVVDVTAPDGTGVQYRASGELTLLKPMGSLLVGGEPLARLTNDHEHAWLEVRALDRHGSPTDAMELLARANPLESRSRPVVDDPLEFDLQSRSPATEPESAPAGQVSTTQAQARPAEIEPTVELDQFDELPTPLVPHEPADRQDPP